MLIPVSDVHLKDMNDSTLLHHLVESAADIIEDEKYPIVEAIAANKEFAPYWTVADTRGMKPLKK